MEIQFNISKRPRFDDLEEGQFFVAQTTGGTVFLAVRCALAGRTIRCINGNGRLESPAIGWLASDTILGLVTKMVVS